MSRYNWDDNAGSNLLRCCDSISGSGQGLQVSFYVSKRSVWDSWWKALDDYIEFRITQCNKDESRGVWKRRAESRRAYASRDASPIGRAIPSHDLDAPALMHLERLWLYSVGNRKTPLVLSFRSKFIKLMSLKPRALLRHTVFRNHTRDL